MHYGRFLPVLPDGLDQSLFHLYFCFKEVHRVLFKMANKYAKEIDVGLQVSEVSQ